MSKASPSSFTDRAKAAIKAIPRGRVATYGQIAAIAGSPRAARQVVWILNSSSEKDNLPWHRVINGHGRIGLKPGHGYELQRQLLADEGVVFNLDDSVDMELFQWTPR